MPDALEEGLVRELCRFTPAQLTKAAQALSLRYRERMLAGQFMQSEVDCAAYLAFRMPATFGAVCSALQELQKRAPSLKIHSLLDLGAGPGTASFACAHVFPSLQQVTLVEQEGALIGFGKRLAVLSASEALKQASWLHQDFEGVLPPADFIILSYSLGEVFSSKIASMMSRCWEACRVGVAIIEPGTMAGFATIRAAREALLAEGGHIAAPCPHNFLCPMTEGNWCHFSKRVARSPLHRFVKQASLPYEDEKFSYCIALKTNVAPIEGRIVGHPMKRSGHTVLPVCAASGKLVSLTVSRRDGELYKRLKKADWGDTL